MKKILLIAILNVLIFIGHSYGEITFEKKRLTLNFKCYEDGNYDKQVGFQKFNWKSNENKDYFLYAKFIDSNNYYGLPLSVVYHYKNQKVGGKKYSNIYVFYNFIDDFEWKNKNHNVLIKKILYQINKKEFFLKEILYSIGKDYNKLSTIQKKMDNEFDDQKYMGYVVPLSQMFIDTENKNSKNRLFTYGSECKKIN